MMEVAKASQPIHRLRASLRQDGLIDVITAGRQGYRGSNTLNGFFSAAYLYETDGIAATIVDRPSEDAIASGFTIHGDEDETILNELDRLDATIHITDAIRWARLEGASAILMLVQDGAALDAPLDLANLRQIEDLVVFSGTMISPEPQSYFDPMFRNYGLPMFYRLSPERGQSFVVHESRLIKFTGMPIPRNARIARRLPWEGKSALEACRSDLARYRRKLKLAEQIMERKQQAVHAMAGLTELLGSSEGQAIVREKIGMTDAVRGLLNGITIDGGPGNGMGEGDKYTIIDLSLGGIKEVIGESITSLAASSRMPESVLFGTEIKGLGSVGTGEASNYHSLVHSIRERIVRPCMEELCGVIWAQSEIAGSEPEKWRLEFNPLWSPTAGERADVLLKEAQARKTSAETLQILTDTNVMMEDEKREYVALMLPEMEIDASKIPEPIEEELPDDPASGNPKGNPGDAG